MVNFPYFSFNGDLDEEFWTRVEAWKEIIQAHPDLKESFDVNFHEVMLEELVSYELEIRTYNQMLAADPKDIDAAGLRSKAQSSVGKLRDQLNITPDKMAKLKRGHNQQRPKSQKDLMHGRVEAYENMTGFNIDQGKYV